MINWKRKLAALLHDPPEKVYDFGPRHHERAKTHAASFGVAELWQQLTSNPDWSAAAADRFVFPSGQKFGEYVGEDLRPCFIHPLAGRTDANATSLPTGELRFPNQADAEAWLSCIRPDWKSKDPQTLFLLAWRLWSVLAAEHASGGGKGAELLPYLAADTRIADGSIWHHCAIVSALEATRAGDDPKAALRPAFLLFQVGPVQDFIAQARSTRDLWSGSYLLSWLTMHAIKAVADQCGPDAIIFPSLKGQPIYDFLERRLDLRPHDDEVLVPGIPNRFLAIVPANFNAAEVEKAFLAEWRLIANECRVWLINESKKSGDLINFAPPYGSLFEQQIDHHWHFTWQLWPWQQANEALAAFRQLPLGCDNGIHLAKLVAEAIPDVQKDERCYRGGHLDPGWAWSAHYQLCQHALDARRAVRDFHGLPTDPTRKPGHRDALSGREEAVVQTDALESLKSPSLRALFRHVEPLGAANLIKRVWHRAYLERLNEVPGKQHLPALKRARESFDSVPSVAAGAFADRLYQRTAKEGRPRAAWLDFLSAASAAREDFTDTIGRFETTDEPTWLRCTDHSVFYPELWSKAVPRKKKGSDEFYHSPEARERLAKAEKALRSLLHEAQTQPSSYYAVLALDGDQIGKWLSGENSPAVQNIISPKAAAYFRDHVKGLDVQKWLASPRPISPSWHLQFSEALAHFGLHAARRIVEDVHHGQLIYSGGDDVLAMLPADTAIACATDLRAAFQGRRADMSPECQRHFRAEAPEGFLWLKEPKRNEPSWPLLVPGPRMTVSVGLAIGHVKEPLQDMISEAQKAEKRAKNQLGRNALAVSLFKRSGETVEWGTKFSEKSGRVSASLDLLRFIQSGDRYRIPFDRPGIIPPISGKFPYRVAELLRRYQDYEQRDGFPDYSKPVPLDAAVRSVAESEFGWVVAQQAAKLPDEDKSQLRRLAVACMNELEKERQPLMQFIHLFALEAFIRRQAD